MTRSFLQFKFGSVSQTTQSCCFRRLMDNLYTTF